MGCVRPSEIEKPNVLVGTSVVEICEIPPSAIEGQMTFYNHGATDIALRFRQSKGSKDVTMTFFSILLPVGKSFSEDGLRHGTIIAVGSAAGGLLSTYISYRGN